MQIATAPAGFVPNPGMYLRPAHLPPSAWTGHIPFAGWIVDAMRPRMFVELGSHHGTSYLAFCQAAVEARVDGRFNAVDTWQGDEHAGTYDSAVYDALRAYHDPRYGAFSELLRMTFDDALGSFADGSVDLLHIDGLHTYDAVRHDFETWLPKLSDRAVVLFHDTQVRDRNFGVWKFWAEVSGRHPHFEFTHSHGLGVLLVGNRQADAVRDLAALQGEARRDVVRLFEALGEGVQCRSRLGELDASLAGTREGLDEYRRHATALEVERTHLKASLAEYTLHATQVEQALATAHQDLEARTRQSDEHARQAADHQRRIGELEARLLLERDQHVAAMGERGHLHAEAIAALREKYDTRVRSDDQVIAMLRGQLQELREGVAAIRQGELRGREALQAARDEIARIHASRSWRITAWMRGLARMLRGGA